MRVVGWIATVLTLVVLVLAALGATPSRWQLGGLTVYQVQVPSLALKMEVVSSRPHFAEMPVVIVYAKSGPLPDCPKWVKVGDGEFCVR